MSISLDKMMDDPSSVGTGSVNIHKLMCKGLNVHGLDGGTWFLLAGITGFRIPHTKIKILRIADSESSGPETRIEIISNLKRINHK